MVSNILNQISGSNSLNKIAASIDLLWKVPFSFCKHFSRMYSNDQVPSLQIYITVLFTPDIQALCTVFEVLDKCVYYQNLRVYVPFGENYYKGRRPALNIKHIRTYQKLIVLCHGRLSMCEARMKCVNPQLQHSKYGIALKKRTFVHLLKCCSFQINSRSINMIIPCHQSYIPYQNEWAV